MSLILSIVALVIAVVAAVASIGLWQSARRANAISAGIATIEASRRHEEQQPVFDLKIVQRSNALDHADLQVQLLSPERLDSVSLTILDEAGQDHWGNGYPNGVSPTEAELFVWGPWQFNAGASAQVSNARTSKLRAYSLHDGKNSDVFDLVTTRPGFWMGAVSQASWARDHSGPVRLRVECRVDGEKPWNLFYAVEVQHVATMATAATVRVHRAQPGD